MANSFLRPAQGIVRRRSGEEKGMKILFSIVLIFFCSILMLYLPKIPKSKQLNISQAWEQIKELQSFLISQGLKEINSPYRTELKINLGFELPQDLSLANFQPSLEETITRYGFEYRKVAKPGDDSQILYYLSFQQVYLGTIFIKQAEPTSHVATLPISFRPKIAIIIDDFGYGNSDVVQGFLNLKIPITVSIIPGHTYTRWVAQQAQTNQKEVLIHMPMEPDNPNLVQGEEEYMLKVNMSQTEIIKRLEKAFSEIPEAQGLSNHMGSLFTADEKMMRIIIEDLKKKGVYFIDSMTSPKSVGYDISQKLGVRSSHRSVFLDNIRNKDEIKAQFEKAVSLAQKLGKAVVIGHVYPETLEFLKELDSSFDKLNVTFTYASQIVE